MKPNLRQVPRPVPLAPCPDPARALRNHPDVLEWCRRSFAWGVATGIVGLGLGMGLVRVLDEVTRVAARLIG